VAVAVYQVVVGMPATHCEQRVRWWDPDSRQCGMPVSVTAFTHRPIGSAPVTPGKTAAQPASKSAL
jgi:hypothetical protein